MEEILNEIDKAEKRAAEIKQAALDEAAEIVARARKDADEILLKSQKNCAELLKSSIESAELSSRDDYVRALSIVKRETSAEADTLLKGVGDEVAEIVGRICRGNC